MRTLKSGAISIGFFLFIFFLHSCGCKCNCIKGSECSKVTISLISDGSLILEKEYCQSYDPYDDNELIIDSINQLIKAYPADEYKIVSKDTTYIFDKKETRQCTGNPVDYFCECSK
ncbi:MAG: hypothetical protein J7604_19190 [Sporocytophaga sp.]|uniref:hypothetical protein n=1 Tax=Sporocytophaga sp. TaxID=2231183 RepID=UPI001B0B3A13|nr:hypothetical protein [Sporocytophaga sp.]MBO9702344.1 hypothetical protein [Sporocytophaga sp.]